MLLDLHTDFSGALAVIIIWASQVVPVLKSPFPRQVCLRDSGLIPGSRKSPGGGQATHFSILAWRIPWTEEPVALQCMGLQRVGLDWVTKHITASLNYHTKKGEIWFTITSSPGPSVFDTIKFCCATSSGKHFFTVFLTVTQKHVNKIPKK